MRRDLKPALAINFPVSDYDETQSKIFSANLLEACGSDNSHSTCKVYVLRCQPNELSVRNHMKSVPSKKIACIYANAGLFYCR